MGAIHRSLKRTCMQKKKEKEKKKRESQLNFIRPKYLLCLYCFSTFSLSREKIVISKLKRKGKKEKRKKRWKNSESKKFLVPYTINKRLKYIGGNQRRFAHALDSSILLVYMCAKRMVKGSWYISPVKRRIIAVEWHDHTDKVRRRKTDGKTKGWEERKKGDPPWRGLRRGICGDVERRGNKYIASRHRSNIMWKRCSQFRFVPSKNEPKLRAAFRCIDNVADEWQTQLLT